MLLENTTEKDNINQLNSLEIKIESKYLEEDNDSNTNPDINDFENFIILKTAKAAQQKKDNLIKKLYITVFSLFLSILVIIISFVIYIILDKKKASKEICCEHCICKDGRIYCEKDYILINNKCYESKCSFIAMYHQYSDDSIINRNFEKYILEKKF